MKMILKFEEWFMFLLGIYLFSLLDFKWWWFPALLLVPDIGMLGYLISTKVGAFTYNLCHHKGIAVAVYLSGVYFQDEWVQFTGIILFSHSAMDRALGYGLKFSDSFKNTHLGKVGK